MKKDSPYCPSCGAHGVREASPIPIVNAVIPHAEGGILVMRRAKEPSIGQLALPGGHIERGETSREALCRELKEELGLGFDSDDLTFLREMPSANGLLVHFYRTPPVLQMPQRFNREEATELHILRYVVSELAFPEHTAIATEELARMGYGLEKGDEE